jgi:hypothetical protein
LFNLYLTKTIFRGIRLLTIRPYLDGRTEVRKPTTWPIGHKENEEWQWDILVAVEVVVEAAVEAAAVVEVVAEEAAGGVVAATPASTSSMP